MQYSYARADDMTIENSRLQRWIGNNYEVQISAKPNDLRVYIRRATGSDYSKSTSVVSALMTMPEANMVIDILHDYKPILAHDDKKAKQELKAYLDAMEAIRKCFIIPLANNTFNFEAKEISCQNQTNTPEYLVIVNRTRQDGFDCEHYVSHYIVTPPDYMEINNDNCWIQLFRNMVEDFLNTPDGNRTWEETCYDFNWGDIDSYIPDDFMKQYNIRDYHDGEALNIAGIITLNVNQDETFNGPEED